MLWRLKFLQSLQSLSIASIAFNHFKSSFILQINYLTRFSSSLFSNSYEQESKTQFVVDAVYAFAYALDKLHKDLCTTKHNYQQTITGICIEMTNYDGYEFYKNYLLNVAFTGKFTV